MSNLLYAEYYKLKRSKNLLFCALAILGLVAMIFGMLAVVEKIQQGEMENGTAGIVVTQDGEIAEDQELDAFLEEIGVLEILQQLFSGDFTAIVLAIFISIFVAGEYGNGTVKNIVGKGYSRRTVYLSRFLAASAAVVLLLVSGMAWNLLFGFLSYGKAAFAGAFWKDLAVYMGLQLAMNIAVAAVFMLVGEICRNIAGSISIGIGIAVASSLLLSALDMAFANAGVTPSEYWVMSRSMECPIEGIDAGYIGTTMLVALFWLAGALAAGVWHFNRADIK